MRIEVCLRVAVIWASLAGIPTSFKLSEDANETEVSEVSSGGGLYSFGTTVALYNPRYQRLVQMNKGSNSMTSKHSGRKHLEMFETYERFIIVDAGGGKIGLHNTFNNRFLKMSGGSLVTSPIKAASNLPVPGWDSEYFEIIDGGDGVVGLYNRHHQRFVSMNGHGTMYGSPQRGDTLPHDWYDQRFYLVPARPYLVPGSVVGLYSEGNQNYLRLKERLKEHGMDGHRPHHPPHFVPGWAWEKFKVVDAGAGRVGLYGLHWRKFIKMDHHSVTVSPWAAGDHFPHGWGSEAFVVIPILPNENKIMLWHPGFERCVKMSGTSVQRSPHKQAQDLSTGWGSEIFKVVVLEDPPDED